MFPDVVDLRDFYGSSLGQVARRMIRQRARLIWPDLRGLSLLGLGYATPYLMPFADEAERVIAVMPATQGVLHWPRDATSLVTLADEAELPLADFSIDRVMLVHAVECTEQLRPMLREVWRVLAGSGRLLVVVPNRRGIWARVDRTPFGQGHPFTQSQLSRLLRDSLFTPVQTASALFVPPTRSRMLLASARAWEQLGRRWFQTFSGAIMIEAEKQIYAATPLRRPAPRLKPILLPVVSGARSSRKAGA
jgi:SAM-dependent methyltransferase